MITQEFVANCIANEIQNRTECIADVMTDPGLVNFYRIKVSVARREIIIETPEAAKAFVFGYEVARSKRWW